MLAIVGLDGHIAVLAVEGKVDESFGQLVSDWLDGSTSKKARLEALCKTLNLTIDQSRPLRYQLLHRACSAIYEAQRYRTNIAVIVIHSFCPKQSGFSDFQAFLGILGEKGEIAPGAVAGPFNLAGVSFYATWVQDRIVEPESAIQYLEDLKAYATRHSEWCGRVSSWCDQLLYKLKV